MNGAPVMTIIGLGMGAAPAPGNPFWQEAALKADCLVGGARQVEAFVKCYECPATTRLTVNADLEGLFARLAALRAEGKNILILAGGDPLYYGIAASLSERPALRAFRAQEDMRILPGISSLQEAAARLGFNWGQAESVSLHGRDNWPALGRASLRKRPLAVLTDHSSGPDKIAAFLLERGRGGYLAHIFENIGHPETEKHLPLSLEETLAHNWLEALRPQRFVILMPTDGWRAGPSLGMPDDEFEQEGGVMTKRMVRAAALSALRLEPGHCLLDLGAGCGGLSVEASALLPEGSVHAVEEKERRVGLIKANRRKFGAANLEVAHSGIAEFLANFNGEAQRIFFGGGLSGGPESCDGLIRRAWELLPPGGRLAASCVLLKTMENVRNAFGGLGAKTESFCLQASESAQLGPDEYFRAQNPVFILAAEKSSA